MNSLKEKDSDKRLFYGLLTSLGVSFVFPEYIAPLFIFLLYIPFLKTFKKSGRNAKIGQLGKAFMTYFCFMILSSIWSGTHLLSALMGLLWMGCFLAFIEVGNIVNTKDKLKDAITALNISSGIIGLIGVLEFLTYNLSRHTDWFNFRIANPLYYEFDNKIYSLFSFEIINSVFPSRAASTFSNPLILATYLIITVPFCAFGSVYFKHSRHRKISRACFIFSMAGLICTESRGACIAIALSIATLLISNKKMFKKLLPFIFAIAISVPIILVVRYNNSPSGDFLSSTNQRFGIWKACIDVIKKHWLIGLGAGTENLHQILVEVLHKDRAHAHNLFLQIIVEGGLVGGLFGATIIGIIVKNTIMIFKLKDGAYRPYAVLYTSSLVGFITISLFEYTLQSPKEMMVFFVLLGFIEATYRMAQGTNQLAEFEKESYKELDKTDYITDKEEKKQSKLR